MQMIDLLKISDPLYKMNQHYRWKVQIAFGLEINIIPDIARFIRPQLNTIAEICVIST